jgi:photosystem II stability/assembly factor-like uncharacterized protein
MRAWAARVGLALAWGLATAALAQQPAPTPVPSLPPVATSLTLFAGTDRAFYRSTDWSSTWEPLKRKADVGTEPMGATRAVLAIGPRVYAGGDDGLSVSEDFGQSWQTVSVGTAVLSVLPSRYPQSDPTLFVGTTVGLVKTVDEARTFRVTGLTGAAVHRIEWPGPALVLATARGVRVSSDGGTSFADSGAGAPDGEARAVALSSFFAVDPVLFAGVGSSGVVRSPDGGKTWLPAGLDGQAVTDLVWLGPFLYAVSEKGVFRTEDLGKSWIPLNKGLQDVVPSRIMFPLAPAAGIEAFLATNRGVYRTQDGGESWAPAGLVGENVVCVGTFPAASPVRGGKRRR